MTAAQKVIKPISQSAGDYLGSSDNALAKALFEEDFIMEKSKDRFTKKITVEGHRKYLYCINRSMVFEEDIPIKPKRAPLIQKDFDPPF